MSAAIALVIVVSRLVVRPALKLIARFGGREVFTAAALLVVIGAALTMEAIGLSMSLGAFLAGVLLADSEFRHELEADVEPFKGLLLGLFFMAVGMSANLALLRVASARGARRGARPDGGESSAHVRHRARVRDAATTKRNASPSCSRKAANSPSCSSSRRRRRASFRARPREFLVLAVTISMLLAPLSFIAHERLLERWLERTKPPEFDVIDGPGNPVIIAGYGRYGQIVSRVLRMAGIPFTAIEASFQQVDFVRRFGNKVYYGDASRLELLESARARDAKLFVLAIDDVEASVKTAALVRKHFPNLPILARARNRVHYYPPARPRHRPRGRRARDFLSSLETARQALELTGMEATQAARAVALFREHDEQLMDEQYAVRQDETQLIQTTAQAAAQLQEVFEADVKESRSPVSGLKRQAARPVT